jgi:outer membrane protein with beta-barrel domain
LGNTLREFLEAPPRRSYASKKPAATVYSSSGGTLVQKIPLVAVILFLLTTVAAAQEPKGNVFFGYSYQRTDLVSNNGVNLNGWEGSLEGKVLPWVGIVADVSGHYGSDADASVYTFLFGPRVAVSVGKLTPFAHALFGAGHESLNAVSASDTSFATALGGGVDYKLIPAVGWRFQGDFVQTRFFSNTQNDFRFSTGIVLHF